MEQRLIDANEVRDAILYDNTYDNDTVNYYLGVIDDAPTVEPVQGEIEELREWLKEQIHTLDVRIARRKRTSYFDETKTIERFEARASAFEDVLERLPSPPPSKEGE